MFQIEEKNIVGEEPMAILDKAMSIVREQLKDKDVMSVVFNTFVKNQNKVDTNL